MRPELTIENNQAVVRGTLTIRHHQAVLDILRKTADAAVNSVIIDQPIEIDLSAVQMIWSLMTTRRESGHPLSFVFHLQEQDQNLLKRCGFSFLLTSTL